MDLTKIRKYGAEDFVHEKRPKFYIKEFEEVLDWVENGWDILNLEDVDWFSPRGLENVHTIIHQRRFIEYTDRMLALPLDQRPPREECVAKVKRYEDRADDDFRKDFLKLFGHLESVNLILATGDHFAASEFIEMLYPLRKKLNINLGLFVMDSRSYGLSPESVPGTYSWFY